MCTCNELLVSLVPLIVALATSAPVKLYFFSFLVKINLAERDVSIVSLSFSPLKLTSSQLKLTSMIVVLAFLTEVAENSVAVPFRIISSYCLKWLPLVTLWKTLTTTAGATMRYTLSPYSNIDGPLGVHGANGCFTSNTWSLTSGKVRARVKLNVVLRVTSVGLSVPKLELQNDEPMGADMTLPYSV